MEHCNDDDAELAAKLAASLEHQYEGLEDIDPDEVDYDAIQPISDEDLPF